jgi:hypothetical protein
MNKIKFRSIIGKAIKRGRVIVFWFHPSFDPVNLSKALDPLFSYLDGKRQDVWITTHQEYTTFLNSRER